MKRTSLLLLLAFTACATNDYQGVDAKTYNETLYPKKLAVSTDRRVETFAFNARGEFDAENLRALRSFVGTLSPAGADAITLTFGDEDAIRQRYVIRLLRSMGYQKRVMHVVVDHLSPIDNVKIELQTAVVLLPDCPDWRKSSNTNYSNTLHSNSECATVTNLGRMVANPRDIEKSSVRYIAPDGAIDAMAIGSYHGNATAAQSSSTAATATKVDTSAVTNSATTGQ